MSRLVNIALPLPIKDLFTYKIPDDDYYANIIGMRVFVPFGKQYLTGVVVEFVTDEMNLEVKPIIELLDEKRLFSDTMLKFTKWISEYYFCSWGEVLKSAMPPNFNLSYIKKIQIERQPTNAELDELHMKAPKRARMLRLLMNSKGNITVTQLQKEFDIKNISPQLEALIQKGFIRIIGEMEKQIEVKVSAAKLNRAILSDEEKLNEIFNKLEKSAPKQSQILSYLILEAESGRNEIICTEITKQYKTTQSSINALKEKDLISIVKVPKPDKVDLNINLADDESNFLLNEEQEKAYNEIAEYVAQNIFSGHLLYGITGSGKTLVYVKLIQDVLNSGRRVLYLLPEISLTPQIVDRIKNFFGNNVAVLHSNMTDNERNKIFTQILNDEYQIVLGVRSAVFSQINNLGLIIVDEEHDASYKQNNPSPRYNARDAAIVRAKMENCSVLLGSATPSLESSQNVINGNLKLHQLTSRADNASLPEIQIVDMRQERKEKINIKSFSSVLLEKIIDRLNKQEGIILFQNRRGFAPQLYCPDCGNVPMCKNCDIALTYHKKADKLVCHYCGYVIPAIKICNVCGSSDVNEIGAGTEKIEEELKSILAAKGYNPSIARFDRDTTSRKNASRRIMYQFINGDIDILVGTQMLSKGIDVGRVTLVGIINADMHLFFPDFRSNERTYQILTQVSGRAGRKGNKKGEVVIQTSNPSAYAIKYAAESNFNKFLKNELNIRKSVNYPPFTRLTKIEFQSKEFEEVQKAAFDFANLLPKNVKGMVYIGPVNPSIIRINNMFRQFIYIKSNKEYDKSNGILNRVLLNTYKTYTEKSNKINVKINIDIDSYQNM
ncbi:MAG: primosomal protein N' [Ignavibacteria bacterium GWF2_33_9]|nr:MAG: primosomal protein N' [Ignavibacteria bacterium GWF2_33_9]